MPTFLRRILDRAKALGRRLQAVAVGLGLWLLYWVGLGGARLLARLVRPDLLADPDGEDSPWQPLDPAESDPASFIHQS